MNQNLSMPLGLNWPTKSTITLDDLKAMAQSNNCPHSDIRVPFHCYNCHKEKAGTSHLARGIR